MRHYILAKFQADAGDWHGYLPADPRDLRRGGGDSRASAVRRSIPAASTARTGITF